MNNPKDNSIANNTTPNMKPSPSIPPLTTDPNIPNNSNNQSNTETINMPSTTQEHPKTNEELINEFLLRESEYKKEIATLQYELKSLTNDELLTNLKSQIVEVNKQISKYISLNTKQRNHLEQLSLQLDKKLRLINFKHVSQKIKAEQEQLQVAQTSEQKIKTIEQQIKNAKQLASIYTKDNEQLKLKYNSSFDVKSKYELIEKGRRCDVEISEKVKEMKLLKKQIEMHLKCREEKNMLEQKIQMCMEELKIAKDKNEVLIKKKKHIEDIVKQYEQSKVKQNENNRNNNESEKVNLIKNTSHRQLKLNQNSNNNNNNNNNVKYFRSASTKQLQINSNNSNSNILDIVHLYFNDNELNVIKNAYKQIDLKDKTKPKSTTNKHVSSLSSYDTFLKNVVIIHNSTKSLEKKHQREIKLLLQKLTSLDDQLSSNKQTIIKLTTNEKEILCEKEDVSKHKETYIQQILHIKTKENDIKLKITKQNDQIQSISNEINEIRKVINNSEPMQLRDKLEQYVISVKTNTEYEQPSIKSNNSIGVNTTDNEN